LKNFLTYIKESAKPKFVNVGEIVSRNFSNLALAEKELEDLFLSEICLWYTIGKLKKMVVGSVEVNNIGKVYLNGFLVDKHFMVEIEETNRKYQIIGFPTGEVIEVDKDQLEKLKKSDLVAHHNWMRWRDKDYKNINYFRDTEYHQIRKILDPSYKKPTRPNIKPKDHYTIGDMVVCKGVSYNLNVEDKIGKIKTVSKSVRPSGNETNYLVEFIFNFHKSLHDGSGNCGNCWWVSRSNIRGEYIGDIGAHLKLKELEEHELDDNYYLRNLFNNLNI